MIPTRKSYSLDVQHPRASWGLRTRDPGLGFGVGFETPPQSPQNIFILVLGALVLTALCDPAVFSAQFLPCAPARHSFHGVNPAAPPSIYFYSVSQGGRQGAGGAERWEEGRGGKGGRRKSGKGEAFPRPRSSARKFKAAPMMQAPVQLNVHRPLHKIITFPTGRVSALAKARFFMHRKRGRGRQDCAGQGQKKGHSGGEF